MYMLAVHFGENKLCAYEGNYLHITGGCAFVILKSPSAVCLKVDAYLRSGSGTFSFPDMSRDFSSGKHLCFEIRFAILNRQG